MSQDEIPMGWERLADVNEDQFPVLCLLDTYMGKDSLLS